MMMGLEKDQDLGLSLGLGCVNVDRRPLQLGLMPSATSSSSPYVAAARPSPWSQILASAAEKRSDLYHPGAESRPYLRGIDVNRSPLSLSATADLNDEEAALSSPNSTVSSISGKRSIADISGGIDDHDGERDSSSRAAAVSDEEDGDGSRKKLRLTKDQAAVLEDSFKEHNTLNPKQKLALAKQLNLRPRQVEVWFQNRRARTKLKQTEVDCEYLKRCCESLTEENRRLQKEVQELRALKLSPQLYMQMAPPTTLTMCPSCERVAVSAPPAVDGSHHHHQPQQSPVARSVDAVPWARPSPLRIFETQRRA